MLGGCFLDLNTKATLPKLVFHNLVAISYRQEEKKKERNLPTPSVNRPLTIPPCPPSLGDVWVPTHLQICRLKWALWKFLPRHVPNHPPNIAIVYVRLRLVMKGCLPHPFIYYFGMDIVKICPKACTNPAKLRIHNFFSLTHRKPSGKSLKKSTNMLTLWILAHWFCTNNTQSCKNAFAVEPNGGIPRSVLSFQIEDSSSGKDAPFKAFLASKAIRRQNVDVLYDHCNCSGELYRTMIRQGYSHQPTDPSHSTMLSAKHFRKSVNTTY